MSGAIVKIETPRSILEVGEMPRGNPDLYPDGTVSFSIWHPDHQSGLSTWVTPVELGKIVDALRRYLKTELTTPEGTE